MRLDKATRREIDWALDQVGARDLARRSISELSGGELQKVLLSEALLGRPRLLLLDEPLISDAQRITDFIVEDFAAMRKADAELGRPGAIETIAVAARPAPAAARRRCHE